ncbi:hypothetical protein RUND412_001098 [Rhizina undulata]
MTRLAVMLNSTAATKLRRRETPQTEFWDLSSVTETLVSNARRSTVACKQQVACCQGDITQNGLINVGCIGIASLL